MSILRAAFRALGHVPLKPFVYLAAILLVPLLAGAINLGLKFSSMDQGRAVAPLTQPLPAPPAYDPAKPTAVVLSSADGAEITDFLPTYEILARSGAFNVYVVAPEREILPLGGATSPSTGLDFLPHFSFAEYEATIGRAPDLIAVPYLPDYTPTRDAVVLDWLRAESGPQTTVLGICTGTVVVADSGLLDGHTATTNTNVFDQVGKQHPAVHWIHNVRYVDDGPVVTSTNLAAGMDATMHVVDRFAGRAVAEDVARQIGYPTTRYLDDPRWQPSGDYAAPLVPILANAAFRWGMEDLGLVLSDSVDELSLASLVDPYTASLAARVHTLAPERAPVRSQHGLYFVPRYDFATAPRLDRMLVPGAGAGPWPYDASLRDLARAQGDAVAAAAGFILLLPPGPGLRAGAGFPIAPLLVAAALSLLGAGLVYGLGRLRRRLIAANAFHVLPVARFALHVVEMVVAMELGMVALGTLNTLVLKPAGHLYLTDRYPETHLLAMAFFMAVPMVAWMRIRGHGWGHAAEMAAAMVVPVACAIAACSVGLLPRTELMAFGHDLMWIAMVGVMLLRWSHYAGAVHEHGTPAAPPATLALTS